MLRYVIEYYRDTRDVIRLAASDYDRVQRRALRHCVPNAGLCNDYVAYVRMHLSVHVCADVIYCRRIRGGLMNDALCNSG